MLYFSSGSIKFFTCLYLLVRNKVTIKYCFALVEVAEVFVTGPL